MKNRGIEVVERLWGLGVSVIVVWAMGCSPYGLPTAPGSPAEPGMAASPAVSAKAWRQNQYLTSFSVSISSRTLSKPALSQGSLCRIKRIGPQGGRIILVCTDGKTRITFEIPDGALKTATDIRVEVNGTGPSVIVKFSPSGLEFLKPCTLSVALDGDDLDPDELGAYLIGKNGKVADLPYTIERHGKWIIIKISILHFSLYSLGDGENYINNDMVDNQLNDRSP